jgi:hypothetical protein
LCHPGGNTGSRNQYANDFASTSIGNHTFNATLEARDSDGDTFTNIAEITARTYPGDAASKPVTPPPSLGMAAWVGLWVKINTTSKGSCHGSSGMVGNSHSQPGYLKFWNWDSTNQILQADLYEYDTATAQWLSQPLDLLFVGGSDLDFLAQYQITDNTTNSTEGFTARIVGKKKGGVLAGGTFKSLGGYYIDILNQSGAITHCAGGLKLTGAVIAESKVPVPSNNLSH